MNEIDHHKSADSTSNKNGHQPHLKIGIPLPGMVASSETAATPYTEIPESCDPLSGDNPPVLPPRSNSADSVFNLSTQPQTFSLIQFVSGFSKQFPIHVKVAEGFYGTSHVKTLSGQENLIVLYEKRREVLRVRSKSGKTYSIPHGSSIPISLLYNPKGKEGEALKGTTFKSLSGLKGLSHLPKVLSCSTREKKTSASHNEVLVLNKLDSTSQTLHVLSISKESSCDKEFDLTKETQGTFTTKPGAVALYLSDIIRYVHSPCSEKPSESMALLEIDKLSPDDVQTVQSTDPSLKEPVHMLEIKTEDSLVVVRAEPTGEYENYQLFEIPLDGSLPVRFTVLEALCNTKLPDYRSKFDPTKLKIWGTDQCEDSQVVQRIFNTSLRPGHEMDGIDIPEKRYEQISEIAKRHRSPPVLPVSIPVSPKPEAPLPRETLSLAEKPGLETSFSAPVSTRPEAPLPQEAPPLPKRPSQSHSVGHSPQESFPSSSQSTPPVSMPADTSVDLATVKEMVDRAVTQRMQSTSSEVSTDSQPEYMPSVPAIIEQRGKDKLSSTDLCDIITELLDCEGLWYLLSIHLGVPKSRVDQISATHASDPNSCRRGLLEGISYWLDNYPNPTWSCIVKALYKLEKKNMARTIAKKYDAEVPSTDSSHDPIPTELHDTLTHDDMQRIKGVKKMIEQTSEELQDVTINIKKHRQSQDRLEKELNEVKEKLKFNEEYALVLTYGSQMIQLQQKQMREQAESSSSSIESATALSSTDKEAYERRIQNVQAETNKLQHQILSIEKECRYLSTHLHTLQDRKCSLSRMLSAQEEKLNQMIMSSRGLAIQGEVTDEETASTGEHHGKLEPPEYYNIIIHNGKIEQRLHQKEIAQLQEDLQSKEDQLKVLNEKLQKTQDNLSEVERKLVQQYSYVGVESVRDLVQTENLKTSLQAEKVDCQLRIASMHFSETDIKSKLQSREKKLKQSLKRNQLAESRVTSEKTVVSHPSKETSASRVSSERSSLSSEDGDVFVKLASPKKSGSKPGSNDKQVKTKSTTEGAPVGTKQRDETKSARSRSTLSSQSVRQPNRPKQSIGPRRHYTDNFNRPSPSKTAHSHRPRLGATVGRGQRKQGQQ